MACDWCSLHVCIEKLVSAWASLVITCTFLTFVGSLGGLGYLGVGFFTDYKSFDDDLTVYTPEVSTFAQIL